jgi:hypothetical protein
MKIYIQDRGTYGMILVIAPSKEKAILLIKEMLNICDEEVIDEESIEEFEIEEGFFYQNRGDE